MDEDLRDLYILLGLGDDIITLRLRRGWSQHDLAKAAGVNRRAVFDLEYGLGKCRIGDAAKVLVALGVRLPRCVPEKASGEAFGEWWDGVCPDHAPAAAYQWALEGWKAGWDTAKILAALDA